MCKARQRAAFVAVVLLTLTSSFAAAQSAPSVDELIALNLKARGGEDKLRALQSMRITGKVAVQGMELPMIVSAKRPNLMRQEMQIQDKKVVTAFDGEKAWMINPMMGAEAPQEVPGPQADMTRDQADFDGPFIDYKTKGHTIELVKGEAPDGTEKLADGTRVYHLKVTRKGGRVQDIYLDAESAIEVRTATEMAQGAQTFKIETELADYRPEQGIMVPHTVRNIMNGQAMLTMSVDKIEFNVPMEEAFFRMPAKQ
jgi:outer membrane lipoprotein-sorting protein